MINGSISGLVQLDINDMSMNVPGIIREHSHFTNGMWIQAGIGECDRTFSDSVIGTSLSGSEGLHELPRYVRDGDTVKVSSKDRPGCNARDLHEVVEKITAKGAAVRLLRENITVGQRDGSPMEPLMLSILAAFAQSKRDVVADRQAEGIAIAKAQENISAL